MQTELIMRCSELFWVPPQDLLGSRRYKAVVVARFAIFKALRMRGWSYAQIGRKFGKDHTTVISGVARAEYLLERDPQYAEKIKVLADMKYVPVELEDTHNEADALELYSA